MSHETRSFDTMLLVTRKHSMWIYFNITKTKITADNLFLIFTAMSQNIINDRGQINTGMTITYIFINLHSEESHMATVLLNVS